MGLHREVTQQTLRLYDGGEEILSLLERQEEDGGITMALTGSMRSDTAHDLQDELAAFVALGLPLTLDLSGVNYLSAACMQALLAVQQKIDECGGRLLLRRLPPEIMQELKKTGMTELLMIEENRVEGESRCT